MYDAIVLAGGGGARLGGVDKASLDVGGATLLDRVLLAAAGAHHTVVVGPARTLPDEVLSTSEDPPGGGPVAGLAAGLSRVDCPLVAVLACDTPFVTGATVNLMVQLLGRLSADTDRRLDGVQLVDENGRRQPLTAVYRTDRLLAAIAELPTARNAPMRAVVSGLRMLSLAGSVGEAWDCDTWEDLSRARARVNPEDLEAE